jgi:hypothetical protein
MLHAAEVGAAGRQCGTAVLQKEGNDSCRQQTVAAAAFSVAAAAELISYNRPPARQWWHLAV